MLIRSKNKMHIVNIENGVVSAEGAYEDEKVVEYTLALQENEFKNMTRDQLLSARAGILKKAVFQMPNESDVEE